MENVLEINKLSLDYHSPRGTFHAIRDVSLKIPKNKIVGLVGESGCGKSTISAACMQLTAKNADYKEGEILFNGENIIRMSPKQLEYVRGQDISMVFQDPMTAQNPVITIGEQMTDVLYRSDMTYQQKKDHALSLLQKVGITDPERSFNQYPHEFSGGMRQRISIAMALLMSPDLLIADEPTTALDVTMEAQIVHLIREMREEMGSAILFVSHNLGLIAELCDEVVIMYAGEVVEQGSVRDIFHHPKHPYTKKLLDCDPARILEKSNTLPLIPGRVPDLRFPLPGCIFAPRCHQKQAACDDQKPAMHKVNDEHCARCHQLAMKPEDIIIEEEPVIEMAEEVVHADQDVIAIKDLNVSFRLNGPLVSRLFPDRKEWLDVLQNVNVTLKKGQTFGLAGESGSGKSTLGRTILGLNSAKSGSMKFMGNELVGLDRSAYSKYRRDMAMMFQDPVASLSPRRTVRAQVTEPFEIHGVDVGDLNEKAEELLKMVGLNEAFFDRFPHELSGGQARRVGVARALALNPKLIVADEPTAGLDVSVQGEVLNLMGRLQRELGLTYLLVSHNLPALRHVSDTIGIMYMGRLVEHGDAEKIFESPAHPYTKALIEEIPRPDPDNRREILAIEGEVPSLMKRPTGCEFRTRCPLATPICAQQAPEDRDLAPDHQVRCHHPLEQK